MNNGNGGEVDPAAIPSLLLPEKSSTNTTSSPPVTLSDLNLVLRIDSSSSESSDDDDTPSPRVHSNDLPKKRRRSQPVKYEPSPIGPKKHNKSPMSAPQKKKLKKVLPYKLRGCGECEGCLRDECGKCVFCKDKPKYGGPNKKRKRCIHRTCTNKDINRSLGQARPVNGETSPVPYDGPSAAAGRRSVSLEKPMVSDQLNSSKGSITTLPVSAATEAKTPVSSTASNSSVGKGTPKSAITNAKPEVKRSPDRMTCVYCGRERPLVMARTDQLCSQRCLTYWQESRASQRSPPTQQQTKAGAATEAASAGPAVDSPSNPLPLALRKLQIDMAKPGTKLNVHPGTKLNANSEIKLSAADNDDDGEEKSSGSTRSTLINSLANIISQSQKPAETPKPPQVVKTVTPAKVAAKRSSSVHLAPSTSAKKAKMVTTTKATSQTTPKSVSFNLKPSENGSSHSSGHTSSDYIPLITSMLQSPKIGVEPVTIKLPSSHPSDIRQWSVAHVVQYFKTMADCRDYTGLLQAQEVDGIALLLLSHETLVKCLGVKLGVALKIMHRVDELKRYQNKSTK